MLEQSYDFFLFRLAVDPPDPDGTERDGSHRASGFFPDERHGSAPTAALVADQTTDHVQAGDPYFQCEVLSDHHCIFTNSFETIRLPEHFDPLAAPLFYLPFVSTVFASRAFYYSAPQVWNCLGTSTRSANTFSSFRRCLKSELFAAAYDTG